MASFSRMPVFARPPEPKVYHRKTAATTYQEKHFYGGKRAFSCRCACHPQPILRSAPRAVGSRPCRSTDPGGVAAPLRR